MAPLLRDVTGMSHLMDAEIDAMYTLCYGFRNATASSNFRGNNPTWQFVDVGTWTFAQRPECTVTTDGIMRDTPIGRVNLFEADLLHPPHGGYHTGLFYQGLRATTSGVDLAIAWHNPVTPLRELKFTDLSEPNTVYMGNIATGACVGQSLQPNGDVWAIWYLLDIQILSKESWLTSRITRRVVPQRDDSLPSLPGNLTAAQSVAAMQASYMFGTTDCQPAAAAQWPQPPANQ